MIRNAVFYISCLLLSVTVLVGCSGESGNEDPLSDEQEESVEVRPEVIFATSDNLPLFSYIESQGVVEANREVRLTPRISGYVEESNIMEGRSVTEGETLLVFADQEQQFALNEAQNNYEQAMSEYEVESGGSGSLAGSPARNDSLVRIFSGLAAAELNLERARLDLSYTVMTAPFSGVLHTDRRIPPGAYLGGGTEIGRLVDDATVRIRFGVLEAEVNRIQPGMEAELTVPGGEQMTGQVIAVSPVVDTETKTGQVVVEVNNSTGILRPGMTVEGRIRTQAITGGARIPRSAILERDGGRTLVFKLDSATDEVQWVYVTPEAMNDEWAIVTHEDIAPGDTLAIDQHFALSHLQRVTPRMELLTREEVLLD